MTSPVLLWIIFIVVRAASAVCVKTVTKTRTISINIQPRVHLDTHDAQVFIFILTTIRRLKILDEEVKSTSDSLKREIRDQTRLIKEYHVSSGERRGKDMFTEWIHEAGELGVMYAKGFQRAGYGNMVKLCKLNEAQLDGLLHRIVSKSGGAEQAKEHVQKLKRKVHEKSREFFLAEDRY